MLWFGGCGILEFIQSFCNIAWHGDINVIVYIVPFEGRITINRTNRISSDSIKFTKCVDKMVSMVCSYGFDAKIIEDKSEGDWTR